MLAEEAADIVEGEDSDVFGAVEEDLAGDKIHDKSEVSSKERVDNFQHQDQYLQVEKEAEVKNGLEVRLMHLRGRPKS